MNESIKLNQKGHNVKICREDFNSYHESIHMSKMSIRNIENIQKWQKKKSNFRAENCNIQCSQFTGLKSRLDMAENNKTKIMEHKAMKNCSQYPNGNSLSK